MLLATEAAVRSAAVSSNWNQYIVRKSIPSRSIFPRVFASVFPSGRLVRARSGVGSVKCGVRSSIVPEVQQEDRAGQGPGQGQGRAERSSTSSVGVWGSIKGSMALPRLEQMLAVTFFAVSCLCFSIPTAVAEPLISSSTGVQELPIIGRGCDPFTPVCGEGGIDFGSACDAIAAGVPILKTGGCKEYGQEQGQEQGQGQGRGRQLTQLQQVQQKKAVCNIRCFRADPVCGKDGVTYWCGYPEAKCNGVEVAHSSYCDPTENGASGKQGTRATQSLYLVNLVWLALAGFLVVAGFL